MTTTNYTRKCREYIVLADNPRAQLIKHGAQRGDLVALEERGYRNENMWIFDGNDIIRIDNQIDDYGALPTEFTINEGFSPTHWVKPDLYYINRNNECEYKSTPAEGWGHSNLAHIYLDKMHVAQLNAVPRTEDEMCTAVIKCGMHDVTLLFDPEHEFKKGLMHGEVKSDGTVDLTCYVNF